MTNYIIKLNSEEAEIVQEVLDYLMGGMTVSKIYTETITEAIKQDERWGENDDNDCYAETFRKLPTEYKIKRADELFLRINRQLKNVRHGHGLSFLEKECVLSDDD